jgi:hypothetical protein
VIDLGLYLCWECGGFAPITELGYSGALSGTCDGCQLPKREVHRFDVRVDPSRLEPCACSGAHARRAPAGSQHLAAAHDQEWPSP